MKETKESEELKTVRMKPRYDFSRPVWEIATKGNGEVQSLKSERRGGGSLGSSQSQAVRSKTAK